MRIALGSIFRNSSDYLADYFVQVTRLKQALEAKQHSLRLLLAEGDSADDTWHCLQGLVRPFEGELIQVNHGGGDYGHIDHADRWRNISLVCNALLDSILPADDVLIYVESDLIWQPDTMLQLLRYLHSVDVVSPLCIGADDLFYDVWGYRKDGRKFEKSPPYHPAVAPSHLTQIDSAGSCLVMAGKVARECRFDPPEMGIVGWCQDIRAHGYSLWLAGELEVRHP